MNTEKTRLDLDVVNLDGGIFGERPRAVLPLEVFRLGVPYEPAPRVRVRIDSLTPTSLAARDDADDTVQVRPGPRRSAWAVGLAVAAACAIAVVGVTHPTGFHFATAAQAPAPPPPAPAIAAPVIAAAVPVSCAPVAAPVEPMTVAPRRKVTRAAFVPVEAPAALASTAELDRAAVASAIAGLGARAGACRAEPGTISMPVSVTFAPSGRVLSARVTGGPLIGTTAGGCVAATLRGARVPAFAGAPATVNTTLRIP